MKTEIAAFKDRVEATVVRHGLLQADEKVMVALSGGADSVALLRVLVEMGFTCVAVHCNFKLRGSESDRDEDFVRRLCRKLSVRVHVRSFDTAGYASAHGISIEMAARDLRYRYFEEVRLLENARVVAVAHHRDDNVETLLLNLVRGTGLKGLCGMRYRRDAIVRPLLDVSREDILAYLAALGQDYVTDRTNLENDVKRNKVRLDVLPQLALLNPSVADTLQAEINRFADAYSLYGWAVEHFKRQVCHDHVIDLEMLAKTPAPDALLYEILSGYGFTSAQTDDIVSMGNGISGKVFDSGCWRLLRDRQKLVLQPAGALPECLCSVLPLEGAVRVTPDDMLLVNRYRRDEGFEIPRTKDVACFDLSKLTFPLTIRRVRTGDRFVPFGMKGSRLVSDYLTDRKKNVFEKERQLVVCSDENIAWVVGERTDDRFRVDAETERVMVIRHVKAV